MLKMNSTETFTVLEEATSKINILKKKVLFQRGKPYIELLSLLLQMLGGQKKKKEKEKKKKYCHCEQENLLGFLWSYV